MKKFFEKITEIVQGKKPSKPVLKKQKKKKEPLACKKLLQKHQKQLQNQ